MKIATCLYVLAAIGFSGTGYAQTSIEETPSSDVKTFADTEYPPIQYGQSSYTVPKSEELIYINHLVLPSNFTLRFDPSIDKVQWTVGTLDIGSNVVFDLSRYTRPDKLPKRGPKGQADYCTPGQDGDPGVTGTRGFNSIPMQMIITNISINGSMWVKTDGGQGGDGQDGQDGQQGGGSRHTIGVGRCEDARGGGQGARGGPGGGGGAVSTVFIAKSTTPAVQAVPQQFGKVCGPTTVPPIKLDIDKEKLADPTGLILIYGQPGCSGNPGARGADGRSG